MTRDLSVPLVSVDQLVPREMLVPSVPLAAWVSRDQRVTRVILVPQVALVQWVLREPRVTLVHRVTKDLSVPLVQLVNVEPRVILVLVVLLASWDLAVCKE